MADQDRVPSWMIALIILFASGLAVALGSYLVFHAQLASVQEDQARIRAQVQELKPLPDKIKKKINDVNSQLGADQRILARNGKLAKVRSLHDSENDAMTLNLLPQQRDLIREMKAGIDRQQSTREQLTADAKRNRTDLANEEERALAQEREAEKNLLRSRKRIEQASLEKAEAARKHRDQILIAEASVRERQDRVQQLLDRRETEREVMRSDGQVLQANVPLGFVIINRGLDHDLRVGTRFQIFNRRGGRNVIKGDVEVMTIEQRQSTCRVIAEKQQTNPIIPGDHLHNPIYNPDEVKIFVIAGDLRTYTRNELTRFIIDSGNRVEPMISERTHYLVAGEQADAAISQARLNGVHVLSEDQLAEMLRRREKFQMHKGLRIAIAGVFNQVPESAIKTWIARNGAVLLEAPDDRMNVLIAGDDADAAISKARLIGATIIPQQQIIHLLQSATSGVNR